MTKQTQMDDYGEKKERSGPEGFKNISARYFINLYDDEKYLLKSITIENRRVGGIYMSTLGKIYITERKEQDMFRKFNSWGISESVLIYLRANDVQYVVVICRDWLGLEAAWISETLQWFTEGKHYWWRDAKDLQRHLNLSRMYMTASTKEESKKI